MRFVYTCLHLPAIASIRPCNRRLEKGFCGTFLQSLRSTPHNRRRLRSPVRQQKPVPLLFDTVCYTRTHSTPFGSSPPTLPKKHVPEIVTKSPQKRQLPLVTHDSPLYPRVHRAISNISRYTYTVHALSFRFVYLLLLLVSPGPFFELDNYYHIVLYVCFYSRIKYSIGGNVL